jgi:uncharacterized protein (TIRG00374 family)
VLVWIGVLVTLVFGYLAVRRAHLGDVWEALQESEKIWLLPSLAVLALAVWVRAVRWWSLFSRDTRPPLPAVLRALLIGLFFNNVLPLRAGEAARVVALYRIAGASRAETATTVIVERIFDVLVLLLLLFAIVPWLPDISWLRPAALLLVAVGIGLLVAVVLLALFGTRPLRLLLRPLSWIPGLSAERFEAGVHNVAVGLTGLRRWRVALEAFGLTVASWILVALSFWFLLVAFDFGLSPVAGLLVVIAINLALILPSSPAALGVFEAATVVALDAYGISASEALSYALLAHAVNFVPFVVVGVVLIRQEAVAGSRSR